MKVEFELKLSTYDLFKFFLYYNYVRFSGVIALIVSVLCLLMAFYSFGKTDPMYTVIYFFTGLLFTVVQPIMLYSKAKRQVESNDYINKPLTYVVNEQGITISQEDQSDSVQWEDVFKIRETKKLAIVFATPVRAFVLPKNVIGNQYDDFKSIINNSIEKIPRGKRLK